MNFQINFKSISNFRPTATELLKNGFFRKAKDKKWLVHALIETGSGVNLQSRAYQVLAISY